MVYSFPPSNPVRTSLSPATIGDESPLGTGTFHLTFLSGPSSTGDLCRSATPDPFGPRNCGQTSGGSAQRATGASSATNTSAIRILIFNASVVEPRERLADTHNREGKCSLSRPRWPASSNRTP